MNEKDKVETLLEVLEAIEEIKEYIINEIYIETGVKVNSIKILAASY